MNKYKRRSIFFGVITILSAWLSLTTTIQAFKCPSMTQTELFLKIPKSFIFDWVECE